ncbi:MAG: GNAT family N-acetyltransferase [Enterobacterales bacterium]|nr:GNAT family N-acetyltransferase [Enterobacterales bacterium]
MKSQTKKQQLSFKQTLWQESLDDILNVRHKVFMLEQHFDDQVLCDLKDGDSTHIIATNEFDQVIACGRITDKGSIGRIAVLLPYRGLGIGSQILNRLVDIAKQQELTKVSINADLENQQFYQNHQFCSAGPVFMRQGVPHQKLALKLA